MRGLVVVVGKLAVRGGQKRRREHGARLNAPRTSLNNLSLHHDYKPFSRYSYMTMFCLLRNDDHRHEEDTLCERNALGAVIILDLAMLIQPMNDDCRRLVSNFQSGYWVFF